MTVRQHRNGDISYWFTNNLCVAIKFAGHDTVEYFIRYEKGRWIACPMTNGAFHHWYYSKNSNLWGTKEYCKINEFDYLTQVELLRDLC